MPDTILIVDDEPVIRDSLRDLLRLSGYRVLTASNGLEALYILETAAPHLILADIVMPEMNGYQLYQRVRRHPEWLWIPFIFLSAKGDREDVRFGRELGAEDYLAKPVEPADLLAAISGRLERFRQLEQQLAAPAASQRDEGTYRVGELEVDLARMVASRAGEHVSLSPTEFGMLRRLVLAGTAVVAYEDLLGDGEGASSDVRDAAGLARYHIRNLRRKLEAAGLSPGLIVNVRLAGYRLAVEPERV